MIITLQSVVYCSDYHECNELDWDDESLAEVAKNMALVPFHGTVDGMATNLEPIVQLFPTRNV